jgi:opacity protein-like surface antigen
MAAWLVRIGSVVALTAALSSVAFAQDSGWEAGVDLIYQNSKTLHFDGGTDAKLKGDPGLTLLFAYRYSTHLDAQFALDWASVDYKANLVTGPATSVGVSGSYQSITPRVNAQFNFFDSELTPFLVGGVGYSFIDTNIPHGRPETGCWWDPWYGYVCGSVQSSKTIDGVTFQVGAGARWDILDEISLRLAWERHWIDLGSHGGTPFVDQAKLGFTYRF